MNDVVFAYHVTAADGLPGVAQEGLRARSYWAFDEALTQYYAECIREEGQEPVILSLPLEVLVAFDPMPDRPGLQEPITTVVGMDEEEVWDAWEATDQTWQACLDLIGSLMCNAPIPATVLQQYNPALQPAPRRAPRP